MSLKKWFQYLLSFLPDWGPLQKRGYRASSSYVKFSLVKFHGPFKLELLLSLEPDSPHAQTFKGRFLDHAAVLVFVPKAHEDVKRALESIFEVTWCADGMMLGFDHQMTLESQKTLENIDKFETLLMPLF